MKKRKNHFQSDSDLSLRAGNHFQNESEITFVLRDMKNAFFNLEPLRNIHHEVS